MTALIIIAVLFISLIVIVPLIERSNFRMSGEQMGKWGRWILPLAIILIIVQMVMYYSGG
ncbi:MAG: hypothetical protein Alis3KO_23570 [Aliiglaciecola sp.]|uniref:hypothetical protein n=1 Tax=Aliiglaciecola sp. M165 TaxID=2593649 RepID=UPI001180B38D|nr:hypothetical protein [Aliiglaciecola sp. M165]TRY33303.1 hypothetical protein FM019_04800 [Aliiglaciecola sp. M165]